MEMNERNFRKALGCFATGVAVLTSRGADGAPQGLTINAFSALSLEPPLVLFCLGKNAEGLAAFKANAPIAISVLSEEQREVSIGFSRRGPEKWTNFPTRPGQGGCPVVDGALAVLEGTIETVHDGGDHHVFIARISEIDAAPVGQPLVFFRGTYVALGLNPK